MYLELRVARAERRFGTPSDSVTAPIFFSAPNTDALFEPESRRKAIEIMTNKNKVFNMQIFQNVEHGFAVSLAHLAFSNIFSSCLRSQLSNKYSL